MSSGRTRNIVLVGPRASGKTTLGRVLAADLGWLRVDSDERLAESVGRSAGDHLQGVGEAAFRVLEERIVLEVLAAACVTDRPAVLSLGGGAVLSPRVREELGGAEHFVVFLLAPASVLVERSNAGPHRPSLTDLPVLEEVSQLMAAREVHYKSVSDLILDTFSQNVAACAAVVTATLGGSGG